MKSKFIQKNTGGILLGIVISIVFSTAVLSATPTPSITPTPEGYKTPSPTPTPGNYVCELTLGYSTYLGSSYSNEGAYDLGLDSDGCSYLTGYTRSSTFPVVNPYQATINGGYDALIIKFSSTGSTLLFSTYLGGSDEDWGYGIAIDSEKQIYITGEAKSIDFPTINSFQATNAGNYDIFLSQLSSTGSMLLYSTYLGGSEVERAEGLALGDDSTVYLCGYTASIDFPTGNPYQANYGGGYYDAIAARFDPAQTGVSSCIYSTTLGGVNTDASYSAAVDSAERLYLTGYTYSNDFPTHSPFQASRMGSADIFVTRLSSSGSSLSYSTYLGGWPSDDVGYGIAVDSFNRAYVTGYTYNATSFPTMNPYQSTLGGERDGFLFKLSSTGSSLHYSTYLGGSVNDHFTDVTLDSNNNAYLTGETKSTDFPTLNPYQASFASSSDAYYDAVCLRFSAAGGLTYSTYIGGGEEDIGECIALGPDNQAYIAGYTSSGDFPTFNPYQADYGDYWDIFLSRLDFNCYLEPTPIPTTSVMPTPEGYKTPTPSPTLTASPTPTGPPSPSPSLTPTSTPTATPPGYTGIYYVDFSSGSDANDGTSPALAWQTITKVNAATFAPGNSILFKRGETWARETEGDWDRLIVSNSGSSGNYITYGSYGTGDRPVIDGIWCPMTDPAGYIGGNVWEQGLIQIVDKSYIIIESLKVTNSYVDGIHVNHLPDGVGTHFIQLSDNYVSHCGAAGIIVWANDNAESSERITNVIVDNNSIYDTNNWGAPEALPIAHVYYFEVKNNHVWGGHNLGINSKHGNAYGKIYNNHVHNCTGTGIYVCPGGKHEHDIDIFNNRVHHMGGYWPGMFDPGSGKWSDSTDPMDVPFWGVSQGIAIGTEEGGSAENINIYNNICYACSNGFHVMDFVLSLGYPGTHLKENISVINNTFSNVMGTSVKFNGDTEFFYTGQLKNIVVRNNILTKHEDYGMLAAFCGQTQLDEGDPLLNNIAIDHNLIARYSQLTGTEAIYMQYPELVNSPLATEFCWETGDSDRLVIGYDWNGFTDGDIIEIDNDGVIRYVDWTTATEIGFHPPLASNSLPGVFVDNWGTSTDLIEDFHLEFTSPAIDMGSQTDAPDTDFAGDPRPNGQGYDIGAYEYPPTPSPTPSPSLTPTPTPSATPTPSVTLTSTPSVTPTPSLTPSITPTPSVTLTPVVKPTAPHLVVDWDDYDGDGTSDLAVYNPVTGNWSIENITSGVIWGGGEGDIPTPGDYDGDGTADLAYFDRFNGHWDVKDTMTGAVITEGVLWGAWGDVPVPGDYDGDGACDFGTWRPSDGRWRIRDITNIWYGQAPGMYPVPGDYNGDGTTDIAMMYPGAAGGTNMWYINGITIRAWMTNDGIAIPMDYDGDGTTDLCCYRSANRQWSIRHLESPTMYFKIWGVADDIPVVGDLDGDGMADLTSFRNTNGQSWWWILYTSKPYYYSNFSAHTEDTVVTGATSY